TEIVVDCPLQMVVTPSCAIVATSCVGCVSVMIWQFGSTNIVFDAVAVPHEPPLDVSVSVAVPLKLAGGVHVGLLDEFASGENVPPTPPSVQVAPVAVPPNDPPIGAEIPPWQISARAAPVLTV